MEKYLRKNSLVYIEADFPPANRSQMFFKIGVLKNFAKSQENTPALESLFNKVADLKACNFIEKRL